MDRLDALLQGINALASSTGQQRSAWLERQIEPVADAARYYAGPELSRFGAGLGNALAMISPGQDFVDAARASGDLMQSRDPVNALAAGGTMAAALGSVFLPGSVSGTNRLADDATDTVVRMLREGRAGEVTDDMLAAADPARLFNAYERGETGADMAMDEASRMARAREMGFDVDTPLYHGTGADFQAFERGLNRVDGTSDQVYGDGIYLSEFPSQASSYAPRVGRNGGGGSVLPLASRSQSPYEGIDSFDTLADRQRYLTSEDTQDLADYGFDSNRNWMGMSIELDPANIRSRFARFDPRLKNLSNLSAAVPGLFGAGTLGALLAARDDEVQQ